MHNICLHGIRFGLHGIYPNRLTNIRTIYILIFSLFLFLCRLGQPVDHRSGLRAIHFMVSNGGQCSRNDLENLMRE